MLKITLNALNKLLKKLMLKKPKTQVFMEIAPGVTSKTEFLI
jgi:hypothetical protein